MSRLEPGDPAPLFVARTATGADWWLSTAAGRRVVLTFADGTITVGWPDAEHTILDDLGSIAERYGLIGEHKAVVLDERLRVLAVLAPGAEHEARLLELLRAPVDELPPPILVVPRVFEVDFCARLVAEYDRLGGHERPPASGLTSTQARRGTSPGPARAGGKTPGTGRESPSGARPFNPDSGFVRSDEHGRTVGVVDHAHKSRGDLVIADAELRAGMKRRIERRLLPEIRRAFQFTATRVERYLVACYEAANGGHFRPHRDNTTKGTAHRRFAVTINLNTGYTGGDLRFPEFGRATHRAPLGGAIVFSCSLLHEATPVTEGRRYCTVPFLYDEAGEALRRQNRAYVSS